MGASSNLSTKPRCTADVPHYVQVKASGLRLNCINKWNGRKMHLSEADPCVKISSCFP